MKEVRLIEELASQHHPGLGGDWCAYRIQYGDDYEGVSGGRIWLPPDFRIALEALLSVDCDDDSDDERLNATHDLPIGAVVWYRKDRAGIAKLIVVEHSYDCDGQPLYMVSEEPLSPPTASLLSQEYLAYRLHAGWFAGNVPRHSLRDTGERVRVQPYRAA